MIERVLNRPEFTLVYTCADIGEGVAVTEAKLLAWNPLLTGNCDTQLTQHSLRITALSVYWDHY